MQNSGPTTDGGSIPTSPLQISATEFIIKSCNLSDIRAFVETHHYSHSLNGVKISFCFSVMHKDQLVGAVVYGALSTTAWKKFSNLEKKVLELRRLVLLDNLGRNSESRVVGYTLRQIKKHSPEIEVVVSYADPLHGHSGTIYKASNFEYLGLSGKDKGFKDPENGKVYHSRALRTKYKGDYKPFVKKLRLKLEQGKLISINLPGKHCFLYRFQKGKK